MRNLTFSWKSVLTGKVRTYTMACSKFRLEQATDSTGSFHVLWIDGIPITHVVSISIL